MWQAFCAMNKAFKALTKAAEALTKAADARQAVPAEEPAPSPGRELAKAAVVVRELAEPES